MLCSPLYLRALAFTVHAVSCALLKVSFKVNYQDDNALATRGILCIVYADWTQQGAVPNFESINPLILVVFCVFWQSAKYSAKHNSPTHCVIQDWKLWHWWLIGISK